MKRPALALLLGAAAAACEEPVTVTAPALNLDRPVDISFACFGGMHLTSEAGRPTVVTAQPTQACERLSPQLTQDAPAAALPEHEGLAAPNWYGFILQSVQGTVVVARWPAKAAQALGTNEFAVLDADDLTPGKNAIAVGEEPIAIGTDASGCYQVTANAGSCDMSILDVTSAVDDDPSTPTVVRRQPVTAAGQAIRARPAAMVVAPGSTAVGSRCPATPTGLAYVAYPSCHLVAAVDLGTGQIVSGIQFDASGVATVVDGAAVSCSSQCPASSAAATPGTRPVTLDLALDRPAPGTTTRRLAIGADNRASVTVVDLDETFRPAAAAPLQIALENATGAALGVSAVALTPRITMGGTAGNNDSATPPAGNVGEGQYVYAVATDDTVRVVDVLTARRECDTQVDPRFVRNRATADLQCFPIADPTAPRRLGARSPGIELPERGVPTSVAIVKGLDRRLLDGNMAPLLPSATTLIGYFAVITSSNGAGYVVNVDDDEGPDAFVTSDRFGTSPSLTMAHQLRDTFLARGADPATQDVRCDVGIPAFLPEEVPAGTAVTSMGPPRGGVPLNNARGGVPGIISADKALTLPIMRQVPCIISAAADAPSPVAEVQLAAGEDVLDQVFPDLGAVRPEQWTLTWEGPLSRDSINTAVDGPIIRSAQMVVASSGMSLKDASGPFCEMGVEPYDFVQFRGCDPARNDCPAGYDCFVHPQSQLASGACILSSEAQRLANSCRDFLTSLRHYTIARADSGELLLMPRKRVLRTTPVNGCLDEPPSADGRTTPQCERLADYTAELASPNNPLTDQTPPDPRTWRCMADDTRRPLSTEPLTHKRWCVQTCATTADCDASTICQAGICMEGVVPPQACVNGPQRYEVRAGDAFAVLGSRSGFIHPIVADSSQGGRCIRDPGASPLQVGRLPLTAPACNAAPADPLTDLLPNPCSVAVLGHSERVLNYQDLATCRLPSAEEQKDGIPLVRFQTRPDASAIKLRTRSVTFTVADPTYPGDSRCILDRQGIDGVPIPGGIPLVFQNYQIGFSQSAAFTPLELPLQPTYPVKVVRGPGNSIWVVDEGDVLAVQFGQTQTAGGVYRLDPSQLGSFVLLQ